jgi:hypothetical protein
VSNTISCGGGSADPFGAHLPFSGVHVVISLVFCIMFYGAAKNHCFSSLHISSNLLTRTRSYEPNEVAIKNGHGYSISFIKNFIEQMSQFVFKSF